MDSLPILVYPDARLKQISEAITAFDQELQTFLGQLEASMRAGPGAVGIAAPQLGRLQRVVLVDVSSMMQRTTRKPPSSSHHGFMVLINPIILSSEGKVVGREGCLSLPDYTGNVQRAATLWVQAQDRHGDSVEYQCTGFEARVVQHEIDHLDGILFIDRIVSTQHLFQRKNYNST